MALQYIKDNTGNTTAVIIPIEELKQITTKHQDLKQQQQPQTAKAEKK